jgi:hypothetical protein
VTSDYNASTWTASELLADIYRQARMPSSGTIDYSPSVVLGMATQAIHNWAGTISGQARDGRCLATLERLSTEARDTGGREFELPPMAIGDTIDSVSWVDDRGCEVPLELIPQAMEHMFLRTDEAAGRPSCYTFRDGTIRVFPRPDGTGRLRIKYMRRHGVLVTSSDAASVTTVTSVASASSTDTNITVAAVPSSVIAGTWVDVIGKFYPYRIKMHGLRVVSAGAGVVRVSTPLADFTAASVADDTLALYGKTPVVSLPLELREPLAELISSKICIELGDAQLAQSLAARAQGGGANALNVFAPRAKSDRQKLTNPYSFARGGRRRRPWIGGQ